MTLAIPSFVFCNFLSHFSVYVVLPLLVWFSAAGKTATIRWSFSMPGIHLVIHSSKLIFFGV